MKVPMVHLGDYSFPHKSLKCFHICREGEANKLMICFEPYDSPFEIWVPPSMLCESVKKENIDREKAIQINNSVVENLRNLLKESFDEGKNVDLSDIIDVKNNIQ